MNKKHCTCTYMDIVPPVAHHVPTPTVVKNRDTSLFEQPDPEPFSVFSWT